MRRTLAQGQTHFPCSLNAKIQFICGCDRAHMQQRSNRLFIVHKVHWLCEVVRFMHSTIFTHTDRWTVIWCEWKITLNASPERWIEYSLKSIIFAYVFTSKCHSATIIPSLWFVCALAHLTSVLLCPSCQASEWIFRNRLKQAEDICCVGRNASYASCGRCAMV